MGNLMSACCDRKSIPTSVPKDPNIANPRNVNNQAGSSDGMHIKKHSAIEDFLLEAKLGQGAYGAVYRALKNSNSKEYAIKIVKKKMFKNAIRLKDALNEKNIMIKTDHPFVVKLHYAFQDTRNIYFAMDYLKSGTLGKYLRMHGRFDEETTLFYSAQIILALKYLHEDMKIVYRDLKPDNILVDEYGYIKLSDFGLSAIGCDRLTSICGTYEYIAPEILRGEEYGDTVDYFSLGCLIFEMLTGRSPFVSLKAKNKNCSVIKNILAGRFEFPEETPMSDNAKNLIIKLLNSIPKTRLGSNGALEIQEHPFYDSLNWEVLFNKELEPPMQVQAFPGIVEHTNKFNNMFSEPATYLMIPGFDYESENESFEPFDVEDD